MTSSIAINFTKIHPEAVTPAYKTDGSACMDISCVFLPPFDRTDALTLRPGDSAIFSTGLKFAVPKGYVMEIHSRSGHGFDHDVSLSNGTGEIDSDYRGEIMVKLINKSKYRDCKIKHLERIAQFKLVPVPRMVLTEVQELDTTERGENGLGSTGK